MTWRDVLDNWETFALDLADIGVDVWDRDLMRSRPRVWLRSLISGLLTRPPVGYWTEPMGSSSDGATWSRQHPVWPNRVRRLFDEPAWINTATSRDGVAAHG